MKKIGITGGIATGKSTVKQVLLKLGYPVLDCDEIVHQLLEEPKVIKKVADLFGPEVLMSNKINRQALGKIIFHNQAKQLQLNELIHPLVIEEINMQLTKLQAEIVFIDIPLLYEAKLEYLVDQIIVVYLHEDLQIKRLMMRDHINYEYALAKIKSQMPIEDKVKLADYVINNEGDFEHTASQVKSIIRRIKNEI